MPVVQPVKRERGGGGGGGGEKKKKKKKKKKSINRLTSHRVLTTYQLCRATSA